MTATKMQLTLKSPANSSCHHVSSRAFLRREAARRSIAVEGGMLACCEGPGPRRSGRSSRDGLVREQGEIVAAGKPQPGLAASAAAPDHEGVNLTGEGGMNRDRCFGTHRTARKENH